MRRLFTTMMLIAACGNDREQTGGGVDASVEPDPLQVESTAPAGSLDALHETVIAKRCSGQPGLCHNGQFEPNLSTPALTYAYVVNRPGIEKADKLRVKPGDPTNSLLIDKIRNRGVATQMPLGAEPLDEADTVAIEAWITAGALRAPGAAPAPVLNNPPKRPQLAIYSNTGTRLDGVGPINVTVGSTIVLRHTVQDFETTDPMIPFAGVTLNYGDGRAVVLNAANIDDPQTGQTTYDAAGPMGNGDRLNYRRSWTIPATLPLVTTDDLHTQSSMPASGAQLTLQAFYIDSIDLTTPAMPKFGMFAFEASTSTINIQ